VKPDEELPTSLAGPYMTIVHMFQLAFTPEIERRLAAGSLDEKFVLWAAQLIQSENGQMVRLNDEIRGVMHAKMGRPVEKGEPVLFSDLRDVVDFDVEESELNCGHFTMIFDGAGWRVFFNFQWGRAESLSTIELADQFLAVARYAASQGHTGPAIDNMFSACELLSKARLILHRDQAVQSKTHGGISSAINSWGKLGNVDSRFLKLFNRMSRARSGARYSTASEIQPPTANEIELVAREIEMLKSAVAPRRPRNEKEVSEAGHPSSTAGA